MLFRPAVRAAFLAPVAVRTFLATKDRGEAIAAVGPESVLPLRKAG
jgi:hypothetical protein